MLAEKFILYLETLIRSPAYSDGSPRVVSTSPHVPVAPQTSELTMNGQASRLTRP